ncbi:curli-like amyloid fiber formation chaperone CsgH [Sphingomonas japonica]|uniref:CsgH-like domain-containing protein n=1 Tax=Sphingomonas japonica TaxID=511662 RepID=A0ABX0U266_9SPHN|nr:curli-like amyloid fiber formation chaperone CsgH [Sphingomonas japonica]NIJ24600.1 hypothetical protein [Sphingomonas japonica]
MKLILAGAMLMTIGAPLSAAQEAHAPIYLETETDGDMVSVRVVGNADAATDATYTLAVSSGGSGSNRSVQSGRARLEPGRRVTLINLKVSRGGSDDWSAKLDVTPTSSASYTQERGPQG